MLTRALAVTAAAVLLTAGCGKSNDNPTVKQTGASASLSSLLPAAIKAKGTLVVGSDISYPPVESYDANKNAIGIDPDIAKAIGAKLGITLQFQNGTFDGLITELTKSHRIDLIMSAMSDNKKRQASVDFVDYFLAGTSIIVKKGNPDHVQSMADFCGKTVAIQRGTTQDDLATAQVKTCGAKTLHVLKFDTDPEALLQVKQGRAVADMNDFPVAAYAAKTSPDFDVVGTQIQAGPYGIAVNKDQTQLRDALKAAVQAIVDDGTYATILAKWNVAAGAITSATVNAGT